MSNSRELRSHAKRLYGNVSFKTEFHKWKAVVDDLDATDKDIESVGNSSKFIHEMARRFAKEHILGKNALASMARIQMDDSTSAVAEMHLVTDEGSLEEAVVDFVAQLLINEIRSNVCTCRY